MITSAFDFYPLLMLTVFGLPLVLALGLSIKSWQPAIVRLVPWSGIPALAAVVWAAPGKIESVSWLLLELHLALDPTGRVFLFFTSVLWLLAGIYAQSYQAADPRRVKFFFFFLLSMSGNLGLIISQDAVSFYVFFALMSFASYGLVVHNGDAKALQAGRVYMVLVVVGEVLLFTALVWQTWTADSLLLKDFAAARPNGIVFGLILIGFGIKAGALPVHVWLPLAHPAAPTPASAVLSGTMIKAGLLGWLRFLPIGQFAMPQWGAVCIIAGLLAAYYAVAVGLTQRNPKTILAYSSISQMGLMTVGVGLAVGWPQTVPVVLPAICIYAVHHAFAKGALFMGVGVVGAVEGHRPAYHLAVGGLILASLALAGAPFTSGAVAKIALKLPLKEVQDSWVNGLNQLLPLAAIGTTLLMARFIFIVTMHPSNHGRPRLGMWLSWSVTVLLTATVIWLLPETRKAVSAALQPGFLWQAFWPAAMGISLSAFFWFKGMGKKWPPIPQGDILFALRYVYLLVLNVSSARAQRIRNAMSCRLQNLQRKRPQLQTIRKLPVWLENHLLDWQTACLIFVLLTAGLMVWSLN
jgi:formate hydrogenlyase subunit 3/multisubunit Na+/H+ antiporter MnhD subunit